MASQLPVGQAVVLPLEEVVEAVGAGVDRGDGLVHRPRGRHVLVQEAAQLADEHLPVPVAPLAGLVPGPGEGELLEGVGEEAQLGRFHRGRGLPEEGAQGARGQGVLVLEVAHEESRPGAGEGDVAGLELDAVLVPEQGQQDLVHAARSPLDVEVARVPAGGPVLQDVPPPRVEAPSDGHVVGHHVHDLPQPRAAQALVEGSSSLLAAELGVDPLGIHDVVAVGAARGGLEEGGGVEVADAQVAEVVGGGCCCREAPVRAELDTVGGLARMHPPTLAERVAEGLC